MAFVLQQHLEICESKIVKSGLDSLKAFKIGYLSKHKKSKGKERRVGNQFGKPCLQLLAFLKK